MADGEEFAVDAGRALSVTSRTCSRAPLATIRPAASFVAHLIAANQNLPQFRTLGRDEPGVATAAYRQAGQRQPDTAARVQRVT